MTAETNRDYVIEYSTSLAPANWLPVNTNLIPPAGMITVFDVNAKTSQADRFYRAYALP